jgi:hypothetical protein
MLGERYRPSRARNSAVGVEIDATAALEAATKAVYAVGVV